MKHKFLYTIRWKLIWTFLFSMFLAILAVLSLLGVAFFIFRFQLPGSEFLRNIANNIGILPPMVLTGVVFFVAFFFILTQRSIRYLEEFSRALQKIAEGAFDTQIIVRSSDEMGALAENINRMALQLKRSIEEERNAERTKTELITSVSHDLRTPLTSIIGYLGLIINDKYKDEVELRHYTDIAYNKAISLKKLIDELFEYTKISHGDIQIKKTQINLGELLGQLAEEFVPILNENAISCELLVPSERIYVSVDGDMMVRVLENLISNAIRYGKDGKLITLALSREADEVIIRVTNYGETIPAQDLPHLFENFYRIEKSRSEQMGGTGLGLAIAKKFVTLHGGTITAYSQTGKTVFEIRLPKLLSPNTING